MGFNKGKFGSSPARARWRLQRVTLAIWLIICAAGLAAHAVLGCPLWLAAEMYLYILAAFQGWHWAAHQRWLLYPMWKVHMYHHWTVYPPARFLTRDYKDDKAGRTALSSLAHDGPLYGAMALHVWALAGPLGLLAPADVCFAVGLVAVVGSFSNWLHHAFHLEGHWMERWVYFHDLRALHYTHHQGTAAHNYALLDFGSDAAAGTLKQADYGLSNRAGPGGGSSSSSGKSTEKAAASLLLGSGAEHVSGVRPGPPPTLRRDGLQEVAFFAVALCIELLVGVLGLVLGAATEKVPAAIAVADGAATPHARGSSSRGGHEESAALKARTHAAPSKLGDFFLFN